MLNKRGFIVALLILFLIASLIIFGYLIYNFYIKNPLINENLDMPSINIDDKCDTIKDNYILPNFENSKEILSKYSLIKDVPSRGKIGLKFYHNVGECKIFDKIYLLNDGNIEEKNVRTDIDIEINSKYVEEINEDNLCEIIKEARNNGDFNQDVKISKLKLMLIYSGMLQYKECLFGSELPSFSPIEIIKDFLKNLF